MKTRSFTGNPSQTLVEQLAASGVKYVFNNSGSAEARFFDALHENPDVHGILALHEGAVAGMAGGYAQASKGPAVMCVHLGAGLAQSLGQMINVWNARLPVVVITYAADSGSGNDRAGWGHHLSHNAGPTSISTPFVKAQWAVIHPDGIAHAIYRALLVAKTPPVGAVHLALYEGTLVPDEMESSIVEGGLPDVQAGYPADSDVEEIARGLSDAAHPVLYIGDGIWKSGAEQQLVAFAERYGIPITGGGNQWMRTVPANHELYCQDSGALDPDYVIAIGVRHSGGYNQFSKAQTLVAIGPDIDNLKNLEGLDLAVLADEGRTLEKLDECLSSISGDADRFAERRRWGLEQAAVQQEERRREMQSVPAQASRVRPWVLADTLDKTLENRGGGLVLMEQFALMQCIGGLQPAGNNVYLQPAGGSEGYGMGAAIGVKLAAPDKPVVGLVGDGSVYYSDSAFWTAARHKVPVLYVIPNNGSYGVVARAFGNAGGSMKKTGEYAGVVLDNIDIVKIAEAYGVDGMHVQEESDLANAMERGLDVVEGEGRPYILNVHLPVGLPQGGRPAQPYHFPE
jgi:benzoylformate decarboxylase